MYQACDGMLGVTPTGESGASRGIPPPPQLPCHRITLPRCDNACIQERLYARIIVAFSKSKPACAPTVPGSLQAEDELLSR